jgi:hypothetical protein
VTLTNFHCSLATTRMRMRWHCSTEGPRELTRSILCTQPVTAQMTDTTTDSRTPYEDCRTSIWRRPRGNVIVPLIIGQAVRLDGRSWIRTLLVSYSNLTKPLQCPGTFPDRILGSYLTYCQIAEATIFSVLLYSFCTSNTSSRSTMSS